MTHSVSVAAVVVDGAGRVLVIRRADNGEWQIPGGVLERGERLDAGVAREVLEETGIHVTVERLTGVYHHLVRNVVALVYRCAPVAGTPTVSDESTEVCWLDPDAATARMQPMFAVRVRDSLAGGISSRNHDGHRLLDLREAAQAGAQRA